MKILIFISAFFITLSVTATKLSDREKLYDEKIKSGQKHLDSDFISELESKMDNTIDWGEWEKLLVENHIDMPVGKKGSDGNKQSDLRFQILVSWNMGVKELTSLFEKLNWRDDLEFIFLGLIPNEKDVRAAFERINELAKNFKKRPIISIDPRPFRETHSNIVPTTVAYRDDEILSYVKGVANPSWLEERIEMGQDGDLGIWGETVEVIEIELEEIIKERIAKLDKDKLIKEAQNNYWKHLKYIELPEALETVTRKFSPDIYLKEDITDDLGNVLVPVGFHINPLEQVPFTQRLIIFDATKDGHIEFVKEVVKDGKYRQNTLITTKVDKKLKFKAFSSIEKKLDLPVYLLTSDVLTSFDLDVVPSVVTADNDSHEFVISEFAL